MWLVIQADVDGSGTIDYIEFITATMHMNRVEKEEHLFKAFEHFDKDKSGYNFVILCITQINWILDLSICILSLRVNVDTLPWKSWSRQ